MVCLTSLLSSCASKAAVHSISDTMRMELRGTLLQGQDF